MTARERTAIATKAALALQEQKRKKTGAPTPTVHDRRLRKARNQRYFENLKKRQETQQRAA